MKFLIFGVTIINKYKKLLGNSAVFAIGNMGSKFLSILLVPLYVRYLTTAEYGLIDIVITTSSMFLPIVSLSIYEATLRFTLDENENPKQVLTNSFFITSIGTIIAITFYIVIKRTMQANDYYGYVFIILVLQAFQVLFAQFARAMGKIKLYSINGVLMTIVMGSVNILFLVKFDLGIKGYFFSVIASNIFSIVFIILFSNSLRFIAFNDINYIMSKKMLRYSIPLIPNAFMWWLMNGTSRYLILLSQGVIENGLFAVANKIPSLITMLTTIFFQAWQLLAIEEHKSTTNSETYTTVFDYFSVFLFICSSGILVVLKSVMKFAISNEFYLSWRYVPLLLIGSVFSSYANFLAITYNATKETKGVFKTSLIGGGVNMLSSVILIPIVGTYGAGVSTIIGFLTMWILRLKDTKKIVGFTIKSRKIFLNFLLIFLQSSVLYINLSVQIEIIFQLIFFLMIFLLNFESFKPLLLVIRNRKRR